jgi:hypothetical protein
MSGRLVTMDENKDNTAKYESMKEFRRKSEAMLRTLNSDYDENGTVK